MRKNVVHTKVSYHASGFVNKCCNKTYIRIIFMQIMNAKNSVVCEVFRI